MSFLFHSLLFKYILVSVYKSTLLGQRKVTFRTCNQAQSDYIHVVLTTPSMHKQKYTLYQRRHQPPLEIVSVRMDVNSLDSPSLAVVVSSKVRRVGLREDKRVLERRVSGVEDDSGRLVFCRGLAITRSCSYDETYGAQQRGCFRRRHPGIRRLYPSLELGPNLIDIINVCSYGGREGQHTGREA